VQISADRTHARASGCSEWCVSRPSSSISALSLHDSLMKKTFVTQEITEHANGTKPIQMSTKDHPRNVDRSQCVNLNHFFLLLLVAFLSRLCLRAFATWPHPRMRNSSTVRENAVLWSFALAGLFSCQFHQMVEVIALPCPSFRAINFIQPVSGLNWPSKLLTLMERLISGIPTVPQHSLAHEHKPEVILMSTLHWSEHRTRHFILLDILGP
jgi:hypothetical protein